MKDFCHGDIESSEEPKVQFGKYVSDEDKALEAYVSDDELGNDTRKEITHARTLEKKKKFYDHDSAKEAQANPNDKNDEPEESSESSVREYKGVLKSCTLL